MASGIDPAHLALAQTTLISSTSSAPRSGLPAAVGAGRFGMATAMTSQTTCDVAVSTQEPQNFGYLRLGRFVTWRGPACHVKKTSGMARSRNGSCSRVALWFHTPRGGGSSQQPPCITYPLPLKLGPRSHARGFAQELPCPLAVYRCRFSNALCSTRAILLVYVGATPFFRASRKCNCTEVAHVTRRHMNLSK